MSEPPNYTNDDAATQPNTHPLLDRMQGGIELLTGERVHVRPIQPDDKARLQAFHKSLSTTSILLRFFRYLPTLPDADAEHFTRLDYENRMALVATGEPPEDGTLLSVARYDRVGPEIAEVAFAVEDHWQGRGIATALLRWLAVYARARGVTRFLAVTLPSNEKMLEVFQHVGYPETSRYADGAFEVTLDISAPIEGEPDVTM